MEYILEGIVFGMGLAVLMGPILIALIQTSIDRGTKAGLTAATGVWFSDFMIILFSYLFVNRINSWVQNEEFSFWMSLIGGTILIAFGVTVFFSNANPLAEGKSYSARSYLGFWLKGFLVNTVNPFTFVFWLSVVSVNVLGRKLNNVDSSLFLGAIMLTIILTDTAKVFLAKVIKNKLKTSNIRLISKIAGSIMAIIGLAWIIKQI